MKPVPLIATIAPGQRLPSAGVCVRPDVGVKFEIVTPSAEPAPSIATSIGAAASAAVREKRTRINPPPLGLRCSGARNSSRAKRDQAEGADVVDLAELVRLRG